MCGVSVVYYNGYRWEMYFGYYGGGKLNIRLESDAGNCIEFEQDDNEEKMTDMKDFLGTFTKEQLIEVMVQMVKNGMEA